MLIRLLATAAIVAGCTTMAAADCAKNTVDAQAKAANRRGALILAKEAWQKEVARLVNGSDLYDPGMAQGWKEVFRKDPDTGEVIAIVSGIPCN
jgi:opacity protein-like surface antigen